MLVSFEVSWKKINEKKYKTKVITKSKKNQKLFTFYVENGKLNPKNIPTPQECLLPILQKKHLCYMVYYFN